MPFGLGQLGSLGALGMPSLNGGGGASLASLLFGNGENGFLFGDFTELDELFTTFNGTTNVVSDSDPVGNALDDHGWGASTFAQTMAAQPELWPQPSFAASTGLNLGTGWSIAGNKATKVAGTASMLQMSAGSVTVGALYRVQYTTTAYGGAGTINANVGNAENNYNTGVNTFTEYIRAAATGLPLLFGSTTYSGDVSAMSVKLVPGNHALQSTGGARPLWRANSGKPYLQFDGSDDYLQTSFLPTPALTLACAFNVTNNAAAQRFMGGGVSTGGFRAAMGISAAGNASVAWGSENAVVGATDLTGAPHVMIQSGDSSTRELYVDGVLISSAATAGGPMGSGSAIAIGALNNNNAIGSFTPGRVPAGLGLNRKVTVAEVARITSDFQGKF